MGKVVEFGDTLIAETRGMMFRKPTREADHRAPVFQLSFLGLRLKHAGRNALNCEFCAYCVAFMF